MYKLQKFRSRKTIHNVSMVYKKRLANIIQSSRKETIEVPLKSNSNMCVLDEGNSNSSDNSTTMQESQDTSCCNSFLVGATIDIDSHNLNDTSDLITENTDKSKEIEESSIFTERSFEEQLASAFIKTGLNHVQAKEILKCLRIHSCFTHIPSDPRTLLNSPCTSCPIDDIAGGQYVHLGFEEGIKSILEATFLSIIPNNLEVDFHIDGVSLYNASNVQLYPIQIRIANIHQSKPEIVGLWKGFSKPTNAIELLKPFIDDVLKVKNNGIVFNGNRLMVTLRCFIADAVARAFVLGHQGHKSRVPCSKCWIIGESTRQGVMIFRGFDHRLRTNEEYRKYLDGEHHIEGASSIARLPMDLVKQTIFDYMHLVCLGVMEKIFLAIIDGKYASSAKLPIASIKALSSRLELAKQLCPKEFSRQPINVTRHRSFKATEHRQILLNTGPVIFFELMNKATYLHFLLLHSAIRILADPISCRNAEFINKAEEMLKIFVKRVPEHYGIEFLSYNIHGLIHLCNDVRNYGPLDSFSAFPYENNMQYLRKMYRKPNHQLQQIVNRRHEEKKLHKNNFSFINVIQVSNMHENGPVPAIFQGFRYYSQYRNLLCPMFTLSLNGRDDTIILEDSSICIIQNIIKGDDKYYFVVKRFLKIENFFCTLVTSSEVGIYHCSSLSDQFIIVDLDQVIGKGFKLSLYDTNQTLKFDDYIIATILSSFD